MTSPIYYSEVDVITPPGTSKANPNITPVNLGDIMLHTVQLRIPAGHNGTTGIQIRNADTILVPWGDINAWLVGNDDRLEFQIETEVTSNLKIATYNTGTYSHTHLLRFVNTPIVASNVGVPITAVQVIV